MHRTWFDWKNILIVLISLLLSLVIAEFILRAAFPEHTHEDKWLGHRMNPTFEYDQNGFRNPEVLEQADIIAIGDSQTEGNNATSGEAWPYVLSGLTGKSVYSMAVGGYSPIQYSYLVSEAILMDPEIVVIGWYTGNDLVDAESVVYTNSAWESLRNPDYERYIPDTSDDLSQDFRTILGSGVTPGSIQHRILRARMWVRAHSRLYGLLGNATRSMREAIGVANTNDEKQDAIKQLAEDNPKLAYVFDQNPKLETVLSPSYRLEPVDLSYPMTAEGWRITKDRYEAMHQVLQSGNIPHLVVIIPTKEKVYLEYMKATGVVIPDSLALYDQKESEVLAKIDEFCQSISLHCYSVLPDMVAAMQENVRVYGATMDGHPKAAGYNVIATALAKYLNETTK